MGRGQGSSSAGAYATDGARLTNHHDRPWLAPAPNRCETAGVPQGMTTRSATHYEIIGVSREATPDEIKAAFRAQAQIHHPDAGGDTEAFAAISVAHDVLADPVRRSDYDATLPSHGAARFSGWSRPSSSTTDAPAPEAPARRDTDADEVPRRQSEESENADDPRVFRRRAGGTMPTFHRASESSDAPRDERFGAVAGSEPSPSDAALDATASAPIETNEGPQEIDRHDRSSARRFRFFGRSEDQPDDAGREESFSRRATPVDRNDAVERRTTPGREEYPDTRHREEGKTELAEEDTRRGERSNRDSDVELAEGASRRSKPSSWGSDVELAEGASRRSKPSSWGSDVELAEGRSKRPRGSEWGLNVDLAEERSRFRR